MIGCKEKKEAHASICLNRSDCDYKAKQDTIEYMYSCHKKHIIGKWLL